MQTMRAFIAISIPTVAKSEMATVSQALAQQCPSGGVRWVKASQMHVTLRFLGDTAVTKLPQLYSNLDTIAARHKPFAMRLDGLGCFPNKNRPRVIWIGLGGELDAVQKLHTEIETAVVSHGWQADNKPFRPHLTLGRVKDRRLLGNINWDMPVKQVKIGVTAVHLIESQLLPKEAIHTIRHTSYLENR